jgi:hypothetical protein
MAKDRKDPCLEYKIVKLPLTLKFISRSNKVKPKKWKSWFIITIEIIWKNCDLNSFSVSLSITLRSAGKRTARTLYFLRPFWTGASKGPFSWGLRYVCRNEIFSTMSSHNQNPPPPDPKPPPTNAVGQPTSLWIEDETLKSRTQRRWLSYVKRDFFSVLQNCFICRHKSTVAY